MYSRTTAVITVLLATYNGSQWLVEFLDSLAAQTVSQWRLLIRDDGSSDATLNILRAAAGRDSRLMIVTDAAGRLGASGSFGRLMQHALANNPAAGAPHYFAFADQDDVWLPGKLERQLAAIQELEAQRGPHMPLLVHSDLTVVDHELRTIHRSHTVLARLARRSPSSQALRTLLAHNFVTGCATLFNRSLLEAATPLPPEAALHDWWLACCAAALGDIRYLDEPLVLYRQHGANQVGAGREVFSLRRLLRARGTLRRGVAQAAALGRRLGELGIDDSHPAVRLTQDYAGLLQGPTSRWRRFWDAYRLRVGRPGRLWRLLNAANAATC
jgi:glycosyltransferase involved in cell wall biosynthesis